MAWFIRLKGLLNIPKFNSSSLKSYHPKRKTSFLRAYVKLQGIKHPLAPYHGHAAMPIPPGLRLDSPYLWLDRCPERLGYSHSSKMTLWSSAAEATVMTRPPPQKPKHIGPDWFAHNFFGGNETIKANRIQRFWKKQRQNKTQMAWWLLHIQYTFIFSQLKHKHRIGGGALMNITWVRV